MYEKITLTAPASYVICGRILRLHEVNTKFLSWFRILVLATWHSYFLFFLECSNLRILVFGPLLPLDKKVMFWSLVCETIKKTKF